MSKILGLAMPTPEEQNCRMKKNVPIKTKIDLPGTISVDVINTEVNSTDISIWRFSKLAKYMKITSLWMNEFLEGMGCDSFSPFLCDDWSNTTDSLHQLHAIVKSYQAKKKSAATSSEQSSRTADYNNGPLEQDKRSREVQLGRARNCLLHAFVRKTQLISAGNQNQVELIGDGNMDEKKQVIDDNDESIKSVDDFNNLLDETTRSKHSLTFLTLLAPEHEEARLTQFKTVISSRLKNMSILEAIQFTETISSAIADLSMKSRE
ncbi:hypothetical protein ACA910_007462 [Epithemia clementina (nom. ined.)]